MCSHYFKYEPQGAKYSKGVCMNCGVETEGLNGLPDNSYEYSSTFNIVSNPRRVMDNNVERILNDKRYPHIFERRYL